MLRSLFGLIAIRGTRVFAGPSNGVFGVFVARGAVDVTAAGKTVTLGRGFGTNIAKPGDPPTDPAAWKPPRIKAAFASVDLISGAAFSSRGGAAAATAGSTDRASADPTAGPRSRAASLAGTGSCGVRLAS